MKRIQAIMLLALSVSGCGTFSSPGSLTTASAFAPSPTVTLAQAVSSTPLPTLTLTTVPTLTVPPATSTSTGTPTAKPADGIFTHDQAVRLYQASLKYLAPTDADSVRVARDLRFVKGADVSNMCGPLAAAILRDAGFLPADVDLHDFWLLNPREKPHRDTLQKMFPADQYLDYLSTTPINEFDFRRYPLKAGDFLYIYAGEDGSFEHMLTVTRVDDVGRAYTVTNVHTDFYNFAIREVALYDPTQPGVGQFFEWTNKGNYELGVTGLGGFELWRRIVPLP